MRSTRCGLLALAVWLSLPAPSARANPYDHDWCEIATEDFRLVSDRPRDEAEDLIWRLRTFRPVAETYLAGVPNEQNPPLAILLFRSRGDFRRAVGSSEMVGYMQPSFTESLMVVGPDPQAETEYGSLFHEYVHYLLRTRNDISIPTWYDEGMASLLASAGVTERQVEIGALPEDLLEHTVAEAHLSLGEVLAAEDMWEWRARRRQAFYAWSWILSHRLMLGHLLDREDYRAATAAFVAGTYDSLPDAIGVSPPVLQRRLERYLSRAATETRTVAPLPAAATRYRCLEESEKVVQISLAIMAHNPELAEKRLRGRLEQDPQNVPLWTALSLTMENAGAAAQALGAARRAVAIDPDDVAASVQLAGALAMGCIFEASDACRRRWQEAVPLLRSALERDPRRQDAIFTLGLAYLYSGRPGDALNYLRIAYHRQPWAPHTNFYLGETYRLIGDVRARALLQRTLQWAPTELWRTLAQAALDRLPEALTPQPAETPG